MAAQNPTTAAPSAKENEMNQKLTLKMIGLLLAGGVVGAPAVGYFLWQVKELSWMSAEGAHYQSALPATAPVKAKERAFYCGEGVQKKYIGCN